MLCTCKRSRYVLLEFENYVTSCLFKCDIGLQQAESCLLPRLTDFALLISSLNIKDAWTAPEGFA